MIRLIFFGLLAYGAIAALLYFSQRRLIYLPNSFETAASLRVPPGLRYWPGPGVDYRGFIGSARHNEFKGTVIVLHGNAGSASDRIYYVHALQPLGYRVIIVEYPGYGARAGNPNEKMLIGDAKKTVQLVKREFDGPIYLWGESLGCGVATGIAADPEMIFNGLVLLTPWDSLGDLAQRIYWFVPVRWLLQDQFDNVANIDGYQGRSAVILALQDEIVPFQHGLRLYESMTSNKKLWKFANAGHNNWPVEPDRGWWKEVMDFVSDNDPASPRAPIGRPK